MVAGGREQRSVAGEMTTRDDAFALGVKLGWIALPLYLLDGRWVPLKKYGHLADALFDVALFEEWWDGQDDAPGLGVIWPKDIVAIDVDSREAEEWLRKRKPPRTPTFGSRRGPHLLFRGDGAGLDPEPFPKLEVLSAHGKALLVLPPTGGKVWKPSLGPLEVEFAPLPDSLRIVAPAPADGRRPKVQITGEDIAEGSRTTKMTQIVGSFVRQMTPEAALTAALVHDQTYCKPPLGEKRIRRMVEDFAAKDKGRERESVPRTPVSMPWTVRGEEAGSDKDEEAIVADIVYPGSKTLCISLPKVGKSTYAVGMCAAIRSGRPFLGRVVEPCNILYMTEEPRATFEATLERAGIEEHDAGFQYLRRGMAGVAGKPWPKIVEATMQRAQEIDAELVVIDVLHRWAGFTDGGENKSDKINEAIGELTPLSEAGIAVLILAHSPWGLKRVRGSTDIFGAVDDGWFIDGEAGSSGSRTIEWIGGRHEPEQSRTAYVMNEARQLESRGDQSKSQASRTESVIAVLRGLDGPAPTVVVADELGVSEWTARRWLDRALRFGFIGRVTGSRGEFLWRPRRRFDFMIGLTDATGVPDVPDVPDAG